MRMLAAAAPTDDLPRAEGAHGGATAGSCTTCPLRLCQTFLVPRFAKKWATSKELQRLSSFSWETRGEPTESLPFESPAYVSASDPGPCAIPGQEPTCTEA